MKRIIYLTFCFFALACSKSKDSPPIVVPDTITEPELQPNTENQEPDIPALIYPEKDLLCLDANLNFNWSGATNIASYQIQISTNRAFTAIVEDQIVNGTDITLVMAEGQDYYWRVLSIDANNVKSDFSPNQAFYVQGEAVSNYIPFSPGLRSPEEGAEMAPVNIKLQWEASDLDDDFLRYDIFLGTEETPGLYQGNLVENSLEVTLEPNQTYYWQVHVSDGTAKSIGELWAFRTN